MTSPFTLTSRISAKEFAGVSLRISLRTDVTIYIAMLFGIPMLWKVLDRPFDSWAWSDATMVVFSLFLTTAPLQQWLWRLREYDTLYPNLHHEIEFRFSEDHFSVSAVDGQAEIAWVEIERTWSAGHFLIFVLSNKNGTYYINTRNLTGEQVQFIKTAYRGSRRKR
jgi:hypothetical protein